MRHPVLTAAELTELLEREFPQTFGVEKINMVESVGPMTARVRTLFNEKQIRPGGTLSGPTMMALADLALYAAVLAHVGPVPLAVTTSMSFNFLRKPAQRDLIADCRLLKLGRRLAVGDIAIFSDGEEELVAHATGTYSIPPR